MRLKLIKKEKEKGKNISQMIMIYEPTRYYYKCTLERQIAFNHQLSIMSNCANKILLRNRKLNPGLWDVNIKTERRKKKKILLRSRTHTVTQSLYF